MVKFFESWLGPNWRTTLWGSVTAILGYIALQPESIAFLPDNIEGYVLGFIKLFAAASGINLARNMKDRQVGGSGQAPSFYIDKDGAEVRRAEPVDDEKEKEAVPEPAPKSVTKSELKTMIQKLQ